MSRAVMQALAAAIARGESVVVATVVDTRRSVPRRAGSKMLIRPDGTTLGTVGGGEMEAKVCAEAEAVLATGHPRLLDYRLVSPADGDPGVCGGEAMIYLEPHMPEPKLLIIGAGHVGSAVADLADWLGFDAIVWDDRPDVLSELDDPRTDSRTIATGTSIDEVLAAHPLSAHDAAIIVTRNVAIDVGLLPALLATPVGHVGLMGSSRRWQTTRASLLDAGVSADALDRVHTPIGIEIHAETPAEIAVSILASIIAERRTPQAEPS